MKKQIRRTLVTFGLLALLLVPSLVHAQADAALVIHIPFAFNVGGAQLPAGDYTVRSVGVGRALLIRSADGQHAATVITHAVQGSERQKASRLSFRQYGDLYFLAQVWTVNDQSGRELSPSGREKQLKLEMARSEASGRGAGEKVVTVTGSER